MARHEKLDLEEGRFEASAEMEARDPGMEMGAVMRPYNEERAQNEDAENLDGAAASDADERAPEETAKKTPRRLAEREENLDPIKIYLRQMARSPLMTHAEEVEMAQELETRRDSLRELVFQSGIAVERAIELLRQVVRGERSFDRVLKLAQDGVIFIIRRPMMYTIMII